MQFSSLLLVTVCEFSLMHRLVITVGTEQVQCHKDPLVLPLYIQSSAAPLVYSDFSTRP